MITTQEYKTFDDAYAHFNKHLFSGKLPECIITLHRLKKSYGYHHRERFVNRDGSTKVSEIALNPDYFNERDDFEILSTLAHEICHLFQWTFGNPSRPGYHDKEFASIMEQIGLIASSTGLPGGKKTGQKMSHYVLDGGQFEIHCNAFLLNHKLNWQSFILPEKEKKERKKNREKFTCPECMQSAWAKPSANLACGDCSTKMIPEEDEK